MGEKSIHTIYFLSGENKKDIFYVGVTKHLNLRFKAHINSVKTPNSTNIEKNKKVIELGDKLEIHEICAISGSKIEIRQEERKWIHHYLELGYNLLNICGVKNKICKEPKLTVISINKEILNSLKNYIGRDRKIGKFTEAAIKEKIEKETKTKKKNG